MLYSIVVPVYNSEKFLSCCIESILAQTFTDFELLLIDDGSYDCSLDICNLYASKDYRIKVINKNNGGVSSARNLGIKKAKGEWIAFCDSDDWVEKDWLLCATDIINKSRPDVIRFGYIDEGIKGKKWIVSDQDYILSNTSDMLNYNSLFAYYGYVWNSIYKTSILHDVRFDETLCLNEDHLFTNKVLLNSKLMYMSQNAFYHHQNRVTASLSNNINPYIIIDSAEKIFLVEKEMIKDKICSYSRPMIVYHQAIKAALIVLYANGYNYNERYNFYKKLNLIEYKYISIVEKLYISKYIPFILKDIILLIRILIKKI